MLAWKAGLSKGPTLSEWTLTRPIYKYLTSPTTHSPLDFSHTSEMCHLRNPCIEKEAGAAFLWGPKLFRLRWSQCCYHKVTRRTVAPCRIMIALRLSGAKSLFSAGWVNTQGSLSRNTTSALGCGLNIYPWGPVSPACVMPEGHIQERNTSSYRHLMSRRSKWRLTLL